MPHWTGSPSWALKRGCAATSLRGTGPQTQRQRWWAVTPSREKVAFHLNTEMKASFSRVEGAYRGECDRLAGVAVGVLGVGIVGVRVLGSRVGRVLAGFRV